MMRRTPLRSRKVWTATASRSRAATGADGSGWRRVREACRDRAGGRCQGQLAQAGCEGRGAHAHHLLPRGRGGDDDPGNLAWLCHACHAYAHSHMTWATMVGLIRSRHQAPVWDPSDGQPCPQEAP